MSALDEIRQRLEAVGGLDQWYDVHEVREALEFAGTDASVIAADADLIANAAPDLARLLAAVEALDDLATAFEAEAAASENTAKEILSNDPTRGWVMVATEHEHHAVVARNHATRIREAVQAALGGAV